MDAVAHRVHRRVPLLITLAVVGLACFAELGPRLLSRSRAHGEGGVDLFRRMEWMTYDWRMRLAAATARPVAANLGAVFIDDESLAGINKQTGFYWPWPRQLFGRLVRELAAQGARAVACDVFFLERHPDFAETRLQVPGKGFMASDAFFAYQLRSAGNVILGCPGQIQSNQWLLVPPLAEFRTNALAIGHASTDRDSDGVLRRARPYRDDPRFGRIWHLGLCLGAAGLGLDLSKAEIEPTRLVLRNANGVRRVIPLDSEGCFYLDWTLAWFDKRLANSTFEEMLEFDQLRQTGQTELEPAFTNRLVVLGSIGAGSNLSDVGATPLHKETYLISQHWNVANSLLCERFIRPTPPGERLVLVIILGAASALLSWKLRARWASGAVALLLAGYVALAAWLFVRFGWWLPIVLPAGIAGFMTHVALTAWRAALEQSERRRVRSIFAKVVAPEIVHELLGREKLALGGALRKVTVLFADVRGFTRLTDARQQAAEAHVRKHGLTGAAAEEYREHNARETLDTVNRYLAEVAGIVKKHHGTLDKYIGDCVMAFWGAPVPNEQHAVDAVRAAIESQRAVARLNAGRAQHTHEPDHHHVCHESELAETAAAMNALSLGTGLNTGTAIVGLMGSEVHTLSYTVFGREVNLASRLESVSGHGRIIISRSTYLELERWSPELARVCVALPPVNVKGISDAVEIYEVPWRDGST